MHPFHIFLQEDVDNFKEEPYSDSPCSDDHLSHGHYSAAVPVQLMKSEPEVCLLS
jgi:hypothetical protein